MQNSGLDMVAGLSRPLNKAFLFFFDDVSKTWIQPRRILGFTTNIFFRQTFRYDFHERIVEIFK